MNGLTERLREFESACEAQGINLSDAKTDANTDSEDAYHTRTASLGENRYLRLTYGDDLEGIFDIEAIAFDESWKPIIRAHLCCAVPRGIAIETQIKQSAVYWNDERLVRLFNPLTRRDA